MNTDFVNNYIKGNYRLPDAVVIFFLAAIPAIDFMPYFKTAEIINVQFLYLSIINLLMGVYFYFNSKFSTIEAFNVLKKNYLPKIYLLFLFFCALSFITAKNTSISTAKFTELIITFTLFINLSILLKDKIDILYKIILVVSISAFFQAGQELFYFKGIAKGYNVMSALNLMKGNTGNINILAASLTIKMPFLILGIFHFTYFKRAFVIFTLIIVTLVILLTGARTALINLFLLFVVFVVYYLRENSFTKSNVIKLLALIIPLLISIFISNQIFEKSKNNDRYVSIEHRVSQITAEDGSTNARLNYWGNAIKLAKTSPFLGIGLGNYQVESIPYEKTIESEFIVSLHAHNDFLEIMAETGMINGVIYFCLLLFVFIFNLKKIIKSENKNTRTLAFLTIMILIVYGVDSFLNFPMYRPTMQIFFALLLALTVINREKAHKESTSSLFNKVNLAVIIILVSITTTYAAHIIYKASNLEYLIATDDINNSTKGSLTGDEVVKRIPKFPNIFNSSESFYEYAGIYYIRENNFEKAFKCFYQASKINPYTGRINFYKYVIANKKGNQDSAYVYIKQAFYLRPKHIKIFQNLMVEAAQKNDTAEILKEQKIFAKYTLTPEAWTIPASVLTKTNFNRKSLINLLDDGLKYFPKDSLLLKQKKDFLITDYIMEGQAYISKSNLAEGLKSYKKALKIDPENIYVMQNIGFYYFNLGQFKDAIPYFLNALKYPGFTDGKTEFFLGICYLRINNKEASCKYIEMSKNKNYPQAHQVLGTFCN